MTFPADSAENAASEVALRIPAGTHTEIANMVALAQHINHLEIQVRFAAGAQAASLCTRIGLLRAYAARLKDEGAGVGAGLVKIIVSYFRVAGMGKRFANGPTLQRLSGEDRSVCLRGVPHVVEFDQEATLFAALLLAMFFSMIIGI